MLKKIMVAMDESAASESAFDLALEMADALKGGVDADSCFGCFTRLLRRRNPTPGQTTAQ